MKTTSNTGKTQKNSVGTCEKKVYKPFEREVLLQKLYLRSI